MLGQTKLSKRVKSETWGIPITAGLMAAFIMVFVLGYVWLINVTERNGIFWNGRSDELWLPALTFVGTALGGAMGVRITGLTWRQVILAALLAACYLILAAGIIGSLSPLSPWRIDALGMSGLPIVLFFMIVVAAGVFLLPLFDPVLRASGPAPSLWKVLLIALFLSIFMMRAGVIDFYSIISVIFVGVLPGLGITIGLILSLTNRPDAGAWLGGLVVLIPLLLLAMKLIGLPI